MFVYLWTAILCSILANLTPVKSIWRQCEYATPNKYIGYFEIDYGIPDNSPFSSTIEPNKDLCNEKCRTDQQCLATLFVNADGTCSFYNKTSPHPDFRLGFTYSAWTPCDMSNGEQPRDGRCVGLWVLYHGVFINSGSYHNLNNMSSSMVQCSDHCLQHPICGYANYIDYKLCVLVSKWTFTTFTKRNMKNSIMLVWTCVDNFVNFLQIPQIVEKPNDQKCTGYWTISRRNSEIPADKLRFTVAFHTQAYNNCLAECNQYPTCHRAWYNVTYSLCILTDIERTDYKLVHNDSTFIVFDWICVKDDLNQPEMNEDEKRFVRLGMDCYRIANNSDLFIGMDECGRSPNASTFLRCREQYDNRHWSMTSSCYLNQSYWSFPSQTSPMNISGQMYTNMTKIFTGLQVYWLAYSNDDSLLKVHFLECRSFNASVSSEKLKPKSVISKQEWFAQPPIGELNPFRNIARKFDISATQQPLHSCRTKSACTDILLLLQESYFRGSGKTRKYFDVPFNFVIDDSGNVYEGRGWKHECAAVGKYNFETICIAYLGWFKYNLPTEPFLSSVKKLIAYAVEHNYLEKDYKVYIQQDLGQSHVHRFLVIAIQNWYRYKGFLPENCTNISALLISLSCLSVLLIVIWIRISYSIFNFKGRCNKCKFLTHSNLDLQQLFPVSTDKSTLAHSNIDLTEFPNKCIVYEKRSFVAKCEHLRFVNLVKLFILNKFLETINSSYNGNDLRHYLKSFHPGETEVRICESVCPNDSVNIWILVCTANSNGINLFRRLVTSKACLCQFFSIEFVDLSSAIRNMERIRLIS